MGFTLYLQIIVKWVGTATPTNFGWYAHAASDARTMARFCETYERLEEHHCYNANDARKVHDMLASKYAGANHSVEIKEVAEHKYCELLGAMNEAANELDELERLFV